MLIAVRRYAPAAISVFAAAVFLDSLRYKFTDHPNTQEIFGRLDGWDGVVPVMPMVETVKRIRDGRIEGTEPREALALAQTPQAFAASALRTAHERAARDGFVATDDALLLERAGFRVRAIEGERSNLKITTPEDVRLAEALASPTGSRS